MLKHFFDLLVVKEQEETWFSFIVYRVSMVLLLLYLIDYSLPSKISKVVEARIEVNDYADLSYNRATARKYSDVSMEINGRNVQDHDAIKAFSLGADLFIHQSYIFGFVKYFHTESGYPKIWVNSFSPMGVFCFVPILMFLGFILYLFSSFHLDFDFVLKISVLEFILSIVLLAFIIYA